MLNSQRHRSSHRNCSTLIAATGTASARSVRGPERHRAGRRARAAADHSGSVHPPSGPTSTRRVGGRRRPAAAPRRLDARRAAPGSTSISRSAGGGSSRQVSKVSGMRISGSDRAARLLHRRQRDAPPAIEPRALASARRRSSSRALRHDRLNRRDAEHHRVADDVVHLVALEDRLRERQRDRRLGGRLDARQQLHAHVAARRAGTRARGTRGRGRRRPPPCRRRRAAARASGARLRPAASVTVSSPGSSAGAKKRCTPGL